MAEEFVVHTDVTSAEKTVEKDAVPVPESEAAEKPPLPETHTAKSAGEDVNDKAEEIHDSECYKEETTNVTDLPDSQKKALFELKQLVREALDKQEFSGQTPPSKAEAEVKAEEKTPTEKAEAVEEATMAEEKEKKEDDEAVVEKANTEAVVDEDGAKTVEAIEESVVAVLSGAVQTQPQQQQNENAKTEEKDKAQTQLRPEKVSIWGVPLLEDERSDVILLKFLRAREFKVKDAFAMLKDTIRWRKDFGIDELVEQDLGFDDDLEKAVFMRGFDREGHPVCYNVYGEFQNKELYQKTFSDEVKRQRFLKWRIQFLEKSIRKLDFTPGGISTIVQINDLKNSPGPSKWELRQATKQALHLLQDNYPEFVARQVFINVPWWYLAVNRMISPFLTQRTRSKFVFAGPSKSAETLFRYIAPEQVPVKYGGLSKEGELEIGDAVTEITLRPSAKHNVEFPVAERCSLSWELRVIGWEVNYGAEFVPNAEDSYTVIIEKVRRLGPNEEPIVSNSFKTSETGKVVVTIDNPTSKKKKLIYRHKTLPSSD